MSNESSLLPGFTPHAMASLKAHTDVILVHRWTLGLANRNPGSGPLVGQYVRSPVRIIGANTDDGVILVETLGEPQRTAVARADIHAWQVVATDVNSNAASIDNLNMRNAIRDFYFAKSPWVPNDWNV